MHLAAQLVGRIAAAQVGANVVAQVLGLHSCNSVASRQCADAQTAPSLLHRACARRTNRDDHRQQRSLQDGGAGGNYKSSTVFLASLMACLGLGRSDRSPTTFCAPRLMSCPMSFGFLVRSGASAQAGSVLSQHGAPLLLLERAMPLGEQGNTSTWGCRPFPRLKGHTFM